MIDKIFGFKKPYISRTEEINNACCEPLPEYLDSGCGMPIRTKKEVYMEKLIKVERQIKIQNGKISKKEMKELFYLKHFIINQINK